MHSQRFFVFYKVSKQLMNGRGGLLLQIKCAILIM